MSQSPWETLHALGLALSTAASAQVKSFLHRARAYRFGVYASNIAYSLGYSAAALVLGGLGGVNEMVTGLEEDVPKKDTRTKEHLSIREQIKGYFSCLACPEKRENFIFKKDLLQRKNLQPIP